MYFIQVFSNKRSIRSVWAPTLRGLASSMTWVMDAGGRMGLKGAISVPDGGWSFTPIDYHKQHNTRVIKHVPRNLISHFILKWMLWIGSAETLKYWFKWTIHVKSLCKSVLAVEEVVPWAQLLAALCFVRVTAPCWATTPPWPGRPVDLADSPSQSA